MSIHKISIVLAILAISVTSCQQEDFGGPGTPSSPIESGSVVSLTTTRADGMVGIAVDAPATLRAGVWIDLDGDGKRAEDGSEDITAFNIYRDYKLATAKQSVSVYGDITYFAAASNELSALDVSGNPSLQTLNVPLNGLYTLDLSKNTALVRLDVSGNRLSSLNVSQNNALTTLWAFDNQLSTLDVSRNSALAFLDVSGNSLTSLDVTKNAELSRLLCYNNQLSVLDISQNSKLNRLWAFDNPFSADETDRIIASLQAVSQGDLWLSIDPIAAEKANALALKGWTAN
ncbi:hypothetical protein [Proteiniphilum sp.]|uniref:hypothetical protein n=1 Tax=Proteiniphilum sp. TaxID=1926877 RepID=UPI00332ED3CF